MTRVESSVKECGVVWCGAVWYGMVSNIKWYGGGGRVWWHMHTCERGSERARMTPRQAKRGQKEGEGQVQVPARCRSGRVTAPEVLTDLGLVRVRPDVDWSD